MLERAGYSPKKHLEHISKIQKKEGADMIKLGAVSGQQYSAIFKARAFDQYFFQIPPKKSTLEMMSEVARKILSKDPVAEAQQKKQAEEEANVGGGQYNGRSKKNAKGYGILTYPSGTVYEGSWLEGQRSGKGTLKHKSGSKYVGDFIIGVFHGRGRFESAHLKVVYEGWWRDGFICGYGSLTMPDGTKVVRQWPAQSRYGGGLSLRGAMELVQYEAEQARLDKLDDMQALYGVSELAELQFRVNNVRREIAERRAMEKADARAETAAKRKAAKLAMMEKKLKELLDQEKEEEPDDIEKEFMT
ncbi:unnamed protein product [Scytosiphon promiscuus]